MKKNYSQEEIERAKNMSIVSVVESLGYPLKKTGKAFSHGSNFKLRVYPESNSFYNYSTGEGGNPINFVRNHFQSGFPEAMGYLLEGEYTEAEYVEQPKEEFHYYFPRNPDTSVGKEYLINERKLDPTLIDYLFEKDRIRMDKLNQVIFPWQKDNVIVGATVEGTIYDPEKYSHGRFKGIAKNSENNFSYNISIGNPTKMYVFEAPIDMLSYWSMHKELRDVCFVSTNGAKEAAVYKTLGYLQTNQCNVKDIYVCSDNDRVGQIFFQELNRDYKDLAVHKLIPDDLMIPKELMTLYQGVLTDKNSTIDVRVLAAIHKTETNLSMTNECTSKEGLVFYFGKHFKKDEKPSEYTYEELKGRVGQMVDDLEQTRIGERISLKKALQERLKVTLPDETLSDSYFLRVENYLTAYRSDELLIGTPMKDWNDKLKQAVEQQVQTKQVTRVASRPKQEQEVKTNVQQSISQNPLASSYSRTYVNHERKQEIRVNGSEELVKADIFQTGQYAESLEPSNPQEMEKLIESYGFMAIDKEDVAKYSVEKGQQSQQQAEPEFILE